MIEMVVKSEHAHLAYKLVKLPPRELSGVEHLVQRVILHPILAVDLVQFGPELLDRNPHDVPPTRSDLQDDNGDSLGMVIRVSTLGQQPLKMRMLDFGF